MFLLENNIRGGISIVLGDTYIDSSVGTQLFYIDASNLYGWAMSKYLPRGEFEQNTVDDQQIQYIIQTPDNCDYGYFSESNLEYPAKIKQVIENLPLCPCQTLACKDCFAEYMNSVKQTNCMPTIKLTSDLTDKTK